VIGGQRFDFERVEARTRDVIRAQGLGQVGEVHDHAPPDIDQEGRPLHPAELGAPEHLLGVRRVRGADDDRVRLLEQQVELGRAEDRLDLGDPGQVVDHGIEANDPHVERQRAPGHPGADAAEPDDTDLGRAPA
jgi:hypothetical protein